MKFSVIVSIYKVEQYLSQCVDSILAQTHSDLELILVDDGSPDDCPRICDVYAEKDSRVRVIHKKNGGLMSTRKLGAAEATGDYLCFIDGDDFVAEDMLENYDRILYDYKVDMICCGYFDYRNGAATPRKPKIPCGLYDKIELKKSIYPKMLSDGAFFSFGVMPNVWSKCFRKDVAKSVYADIPDELSLGEDAAAVYPALLVSDSVYMSDYCGYMYRSNPASMTRTYNKKLYTHLVNLLSHLKAVEEKMSWKFGEQLDRYAFFLLRCAVTNELRYNRQGNYFCRRKSLLRFLNNDLFISAMRGCKLEGKKDRAALFFLKNKITLPFALDKH